MSYEQPPIDLDSSEEEIKKREVELQKSLERFADDVKRAQSIESIITQIKKAKL